LLQQAQLVGQGIGQAIAEVRVLPGPQFGERQHPDHRLAAVLLDPALLPGEEEDHGDGAYPDDQSVGIVAEAAHGGARHPFRQGVALDPCGGQLEEPGQQQGDGKAGDHHHDEGAHHPAGGAERFQHHIADLQQQPGDQGIAQGHAQHAALAQALQPARVGRLRRLLVLVVHPLSEPACTNCTADNLAEYRSRHAGSDPAYGGSIGMDPGLRRDDGNK